MVFAFFVTLPLLNTFIILLYFYSSVAFLNLHKYTISCPNKTKRPSFIISQSIQIEEYVRSDNLSLYSGRFLIYLPVLYPVVFPYQLQRRWRWRRRRRISSNHSLQGSGRTAWTWRFCLKQSNHQQTYACNIIHLKTV